MTRGDVVVAALPGDASKPRPAVVLRAARFAAHHRVTVLPITSVLQDAAPLRVDLTPTPANGLRAPSQAMIDRIASVAVQRVGQIIGELAAADLKAIERAVLVYLGIADTAPRAGPRKKMTAVTQKKVRLRKKAR